MRAWATEQEREQKQDQFEYHALRTLGQPLAMFPILPYSVFRA